MHTPLSVVFIAFILSSCVTTSRPWKTANKSEIPGICDELVLMSRADTLETRKETMDKLGFETTSYTDGVARVSVLTRPDLVVVVTHSPATPTKGRSDKQTERMWKAVLMQVEAIHTTIKKANGKVETIFVAEQMRWNDPDRAFLQAMISKFKVQTVALEKTATAIHSADETSDADIL